MSARRHCGGFTLVEAIATIVVIATLSTGASVIIVDAADAYADSATVSELHTEASVALDRIVRELRSIENDPAGAGVARIANVDTSSIHFNQADVIRLDGDEILLTKVGAGDGVLVRDVSSFTIEAFDEADAPLAMPMNGAAAWPIQRVALTLTLSRNGRSETIRTRVFLRATMSDTAGAP